MDNKTVSIESFEKVAIGMAVEVHLMVDNPIAYVGRCDRVGVERVYGHIEQMEDMGEFVDQVTDLGIQAGLALDLDTPVADIEKMLPYLDGVLLMSVKAGYSGQEFSEEVLSKIEELREQEFKGDICIDGGMNEETIAICAGKGANHFGVTSQIWKAKNIKERLVELRGIRLN